jgi:predicted RNA-binding Zn ribbon-like protein
LFDGVNPQLEFDGVAAVSAEPKKPPADVELVSAFVNTKEKNTSRPDDEWLDSPDALRRWMEAHGIHPGNGLDAEDVTRAIEFREAIRLLLAANNAGPLRRDTVEALRDAAHTGLIRVDIGADGRAVPEPAASGVAALFARILAAIADSQAAGTWERLKACAADDCQWAFYDSSRNRSRTWCSMEVCGNRAKTRAYRARLSKSE